MSGLQLIPHVSEKVWGYEQWQFSTHRNGMTKIAQTQEPLVTKTGDLPIMIKYIVANETLSVQVHPDDVYAAAHTNDKGKTECWYITEAEPGAKLIFGLKPNLTAEQLAQILAAGTLETYLAFIEVEAGDMIYIPAGTVHAIMGGLKLIEVQQSSDTTYRLYDWGRDREMHWEQSLAVIDYAQKNGAKKIPATMFEQLQTPYFTVTKQRLDAQWQQHYEQPVAVTVVSAAAVFEIDGDTIHVDHAQTLYLEPNTQITSRGDGDILITTWE